MKRLLHIFLLTAVFCALLVAPAHALEYTIDAPDDYLFGRPTSDDTIYEWENPNVDRSKNTALIPPAFGSPTSCQRRCDFVVFRRTDNVEKWRVNVYSL